MNKFCFKEFKYRNQKKMFVWLNFSRINVEDISEIFNNLKEVGDKRESYKEKIVVRY